MFKTNPQSGVPIYLQLIEQVRHAIELGALRPGDQLPGIRKLAKDLVMNPNTVAKAYREMEHAGLIELRHGAGAFVAHNDGAERQAVQKGRAVMRRAVRGLREIGLDDGAVRRLLESELTNEAKGLENDRSGNRGTRADQVVRPEGPDVRGPARRHLRISRS